MGFISVWKKWLHCLCFIKPKFESICLSVTKAETDSVSVSVLCIFVCVFLWVFVCERGEDRETERQRGGAACSKWKFHFPCLSSLSQQLVLVRIRPFFFSGFSPATCALTYLRLHHLYITALTVHYTRIYPNLASKVFSSALLMYMTQLCSTQQNSSN